MVSSKEVQRNARGYKILGCQACGVKDGAVNIEIRFGVVLGRFVSERNILSSKLPYRRSKRRLTAGSELCALETNLCALETNLPLEIQFACSIVEHCSLISLKSLVRTVLESIVTFAALQAKTHLLSDLMIGP